MTLIILFIGILLLGIVFTYLANNFDSIICAICGIGSILVGIIALIACLSISFTLKSDWEYYKAQYYNLRQQVEYVDKDDILTSENLRNQVLDMNNKIDSHKIYHNNFWLKDFYSEEIGNLPKLEWKSK